MQGYFDIVDMGEFGHRVNSDSIEHKEWGCYLNKSRKLFH